MDDQQRLERIELKLDQVIELHGNRLTKLETQAGFFQLGLAFLITSVGGVLTKLLMDK